jgi:uncharacterized protein YigA (DUF484 family)
MLRAEDVAKYLQEHPAFFDEYADLLSSISVPHPHGSHAIPLSERQILSLREKTRALEGKLRELIQFGEENDLISDRVHRIAVALIGARDLSGLLQSLYENLHEDFGVPGVALRLWWAEPDAQGSSSTTSPRPELEPVSEEARVFAESLTNPYFSDTAMFETGAWFGPMAGDFRSFAYVGLRGERAFGVLALASTDAQRFTQDMGILYLARLGELASVALRRQVES